jgi:hypothetical protein
MGDRVFVFIGMEITRDRDDLYIPRFWHFKSFPPIFKGHFRLKCNFTCIIPTYIIYHTYNNISLCCIINFVVYLWPPVCISVARHQKHKQTNRSRGLPFSKSTQSKQSTFCENSSNLVTLLEKFAAVGKWRPLSTIHRNLSAS